MVQRTVDFGRTPPDSVLQKPSCVVCHGPCLVEVLRPLRLDSSLPGDLVVYRPSSDESFRGLFGLGLFGDSPVFLF